MPLMLSMAGYFMVAVGYREFRLSARIGYYVLLAFVILALVDLFTLFVGDKFNYSYVASYSSRDLSLQWPHFFKVSALWAGQQGTFLLWLVFGTLLGLWVRSKAKENEGWVMFFYILAQSFLLILTIVSDPFKQLDFMPADGQGLNPLLQNYWMQIHPPIVFLGFASGCIPFAFAMASLAANKYDNWVKQTMPWAIFSMVTLGLGIFLGGYWAYETLGWGGYWAWDPVENASFIPWMTGIALVHGMVIERARGSWRRTNLFLAITLFMLVVYGTFLTRSGVLADFSVHSFVDLGYNNLLWASILFLGVISYGLWIYRARKMSVPNAHNEVLTQEFSTFLSVALLLPFTLLVLIWTSYPLITTILSKIPVISRISPTPAAIQAENYNMAGLVFGVIFAIIIGFNALLDWKKTQPEVFKKKLIVPTITSIITGIIFVLIAWPRIVEKWSSVDMPEVTFKVIIGALLVFLFFASAMFGLVSNLIFIFNRIKSGIVYLGGYISHVGFSILLLGIILSSVFSISKKANIGMGESKAVLGYDIKFDGTGKISPKEEKTEFTVTQGQSTFSGHTLSKEMRRGNDVQYARTPYIEKSLFSDFYLSLENLYDPGQGQMQPVDLKQGESHDYGDGSFAFLGFDSDENARKMSELQNQIFELRKGEQFEIDGRAIQFEKFEMGAHKAEGSSRIGAILNVTSGGATKSITPYFEPQADDHQHSATTSLPGGGFISVIKIKADIGSVVLSYSKTSSIPDIRLGALFKLQTGADSTIITVYHSPSSADHGDRILTLSNGYQAFLVGVEPKNNTASLMLIPPQQPLLASIEVTHKPLINLVWIGFMIIVVGSIIGVVRRMRESKQA